MPVNSAETIKTRDGREFVLNTQEEDAAITAAVMSDPDARPMSDAEWESLRPAIRIGRGWQTRGNEVLREWLRTQRAA